MNDTHNQNSQVAKNMDEMMNGTESELASLKAEQNIFTVDPATQFPPAQVPGKYIVFTLAETRYAVPITQVIEVGEVKHITPVPNAPEWILGVTNLHGDVISVVDCCSLLKLRTRVSPATTNICVVRNKEANLITSLLVDKIEGLAQLMADTLMLPEQHLTETVVPFVWNASDADGQTLQILNLEELLSSMMLN